MSKIIDSVKRSARFRVSLPFFSYEVNLNDLVDSSTIDERISKLGRVKEDLEAAIVAVSTLQKEAEKHREEANKLSETVSMLSKERLTAEALLKIPEDSFTRLLTKANSKGRWRGIVEGAIVGFITGVLSSFVVWLLTK